jgi:NADH-quinone oxidoreductase subunit N
VTAGSIDLASIRAITPQLGLFLLGVVVFILDLVWKGDQRKRLSGITAAGLVLVGAASAIWGIPSADGSLVFGGMLRHDWLAFAFTLVFLFGGTITALLARNDEGTGKRGEFYLLMIISILGMTLMAGSADLILLFLAIETTSIPLYVLAGFQRKNAASVEAGFKYLLYGSLTSALMLYGFSLLYGFTGTTQMAGIMEQLRLGSLPVITISGVMVLILVGIGFKISAVPFHFWAPDVYQGAPSQVSGFLSTASKAAGFSVLLRLFMTALLPNAAVWFILIAVLSAASMTFGNLQAINQKNIKRLLAYSSIAQAGYVLVGVAAISELGVSAVVFYLMAYLVTNLAAFGIVTVIGRKLGSDEISAYAGLSRRSPELALGLLAAFLSLAGIPPFAGFVGKVLLFTSAMQAHLAWLVGIGIINSIIGLYYYLVVLKVAYLDRSEGDEQPLRLEWSAKTAVILCLAGVVLAGILFGPLFELTRAAAAGIY